MQYHAEPQAHHARTTFPYVSTSPTALIVPGLNGSCDEHWQSVWEKERTDCARVDLGNWSDPTPDAWVKRLDETIRASAAPVVLVAHSLGCIATMRWVQSHFHACRDRVKGALLVAPCDPESDLAAPVLRRFAPIPRCRLEVRSILVASTNDPYASLTRSKQMAKMWGSEFVNLGTAGHINAHSNLGAWGLGQTLLGLLQDDPLARA